MRFGKWFSADSLIEGLSVIGAGDVREPREERAGHRLGHLGGIACAEGRQGPIVFNGMEMLFSHGATHLFQLNGNVDVDWCEKPISMELKWLRLSVRRTGFNSIEIVAPLLRWILAYPVSLTSREVEPHQKLFAATSLSCLFCKSVFYRKTAGGCRAFCRRWSSPVKKWVNSSRLDQARGREVWYNIRTKGKAE